MKRIIVILSVYNLWIKQKTKSKTINFYDAVNHGIAKNYNFNQLLADYRYITEHDDILIDEEEEITECKAVECHILNRNGRNRKYYKTLNGELNTLMITSNT